jgi:hypothetical protein
MIPTITAGSPHFGIDRFARLRLAIQSSNPAAATARNGEVTPDLVTLCPAAAGANVGYDLAVVADQVVLEGWLTFQKELSALYDLPWLVGRRMPPAERAAVPVAYDCRGPATLEVPQRDCVDADAALVLQE